VFLVLLLGLARWSSAQAIPVASRSAVLQLGAGWSISNPDYGGHNIQGLTIFGDLNFTRHWSIEGDIHRTSIHTVSCCAADSYLIGPRYTFHFKRFEPYAKGLLGFGRFKYEDYGTTYTYKIYSIGGGLDYRATRRINIRAIDYEHQSWPGFPPSGLTPYVLTFGAAYVF